VGKEYSALSIMGLVYTDFKKMEEKVNLFDISGKRVLISGSSQGLGFAMAQGLAENGAIVILNGRNQDRLRKAEAELKKIHSEIYSFNFDVTDEQAVIDNIDKIESTVGPIDVLINNAGINVRGQLEDFSSDDWSKLMDINLNAVFYLGKAVAKKMIPRNKGKIINIASLVSQAARKSIAPYTASKGAVKMLTKGMAIDWAQYNIQVNAIGPGYFATEMNTALVNDKDFDAWVKSKTPAARWGNPEELVGAAQFLSSKASDFITGQIMYVDGRWMSAL
jgi:gluconate 5-dehydrogenase